MDKAKSLAGIEIMAVGTHNGDKFTVADLDAMVSAFGALDFRPAVKLGHVADETGLPAAGYIDNLRRVGSKLVGDLVDIPEKVYDAIQSKQFNRLSAEVFFNFRRGGQVFRRALKAVALLGVEIPAVAGLKPLVGEFSSTDYDRLAMFDSEIEGGNDMAELEELRAKVKELESKLKAQDVAELETLREQHLSLSRELDETKQREAKATARAAELESATREATAKAKAEGVKVPAFRECIRALYSLAAGETRETAYSVGDKTEQVTLERIADDLVKEINAKAATLFSAQSVAFKPVEATDETKSAGQEVDEKAKAYAAANKVDYAQAIRAVLNADQDLRTRYAQAAYNVQ